jgi:hypothetical protein
MHTFIKNVYWRENAIEVTDYPYGFSLRTSLFIWVEHKPNKWYRIGRSTINPKTGRENKPKYSTYSDYYRLYENEEGYIKTASYSWNSASKLDDLIKTGMLDEFSSEFIENQKNVMKILTIKSFAIYWGYDLDKIKGLTFDELVELEQNDSTSNREYIDKFKTEEGKNPNYSPFKVVSHNYNTI